MRIIIEDAPTAPAANAATCSTCAPAIEAPPAEPNAFAEISRKANRREIKDGHDVYDLLFEALRESKQEHYILVMCDVHGKLLDDGIVEVAKGQRSRVSVGVEDIIREVTLRNADRFIAVHNHPSGTADASDDDRGLTDIIAAAFPSALGKPKTEVKTGIDCIFVDHIVIAGQGGGSFFSFLENKVIKVRKRK